jgi:hypothetical protein
MLRLVHLFKGIGLSFLLFCLPVTGQITGRPVYSDYAVFKISDQVFFKSDFLKIKEKIKTFNCVYPESLILKSLRLSGEEVNKIPSIPNSNNKFPSGLVSFLDKLILLKKVHIFLDI